MALSEGQGKAAVAVLQGEELAVVVGHGQRVVVLDEEVGTVDQRSKNPYSKLALLSGKKLRVRKNFARMIKTNFEKPKLPG